MRNKLLLGLFVAAASSSVFAVPYDPINHPGIFEVQLTGGGYVATTNDLGYGIGVASTINGHYNGSILDVDPSYKFGGAVQLGYFFCNSTINVDASYFGTHHNLSDSSVGSIQPTLSIPDLTENAEFAASDYSFKYDFVNLEVGSLTRIGQNGLIINPKVGLSYAHIKGDQNAVYSGGDFDPNQVLGAGQSTSFDGFGPSIGFDLNYIVCAPISLMGSFRYSGLIGSVKSGTNTDLYVDGSITDASSLTGKDKKSLVSVIQSELAIGYDFDWVDYFCGNIALGYQVTKFFNNGTHASFVDDVADGQYVSLPVSSGIHGWFLRLTMDFAM